MKKQQLHRLKRILKFEESNLENLIQVQQTQVMLLNSIRRKIDNLNELKTEALNPMDHAAGFNLDVVNSQRDYIHRIEQLITQTQTSESDQIQAVNSAREQVLNQRTRVKALETLIEKIEQDAIFHQLHSEYIDLGDSILNRFVEPKQ